MLQIKKRKDGKLKRRFMTTICFYQDRRHEKPLHWIKKVLGIGYVSRRNDGISELRVNGFQQVRNIIKNLLPFIRFKRKQAEAMRKAVTILSKQKSNQLNRKELLNLVNHILVIQSNNYITKKKKTKEELLKVLDLTP